MCYAHFRNVFSYMLVGSVRIVVTVLVAAVLCEGVARKKSFFLLGEVALNLVLFVYSIGFKQTKIIGGFESVNMPMIVRLKPLLLCLFSDDVFTRCSADV